MRRRQHIMQKMRKLLPFHRKIKHGTGVVKLKTENTCNNCLILQCSLRETADGCYDDEKQTQEELKH